MNKEWSKYISLIFIILGVLSGSVFLILIGGLMFWSAYQNYRQTNGYNSDFKQFIKDEYLKDFNFNKFNNKKSNIDLDNNNYNFNNNQNNMETIDPKKGKKIAGLIAGAVFAVLILANSIIVIPAGYTGIYHLFGKVKDKPYSSGIHLIIPLAKIEKMSVRTQEYTMSIATAEGKVKGDDSILALTKEGLSVALDLTVLYHLDEQKSPEVFKTIGINYEEIIIRPEIRTTIREIVAQYEAKEIYSEKRTEAAMKILENIKNSVEPRGIVIEDVLVRNVNLPQKLADSIEAKLQAEQEAQRYDFVLERETKEAERKRIEAEGQRDAQQIIAQGLTSNYLNYLYIKELKDREGTIYVPVGNNGVPLFRGI